MTESLLDYITTPQEELVRASVQSGDALVTYSVSAALEQNNGFTPRLEIREDLWVFAEWYVDYYSVFTTLEGRKPT